MADAVEEYISCADRCTHIRAHLQDLTTREDFIPFSRKQQTLTEMVALSNTLH
jgi:hypothetical protein